MPWSAHLRLQPGIDSSAITRAERGLFDETPIARDNKIRVEKVSNFTMNQQTHIKPSFLDSFFFTYFHNFSLLRIAIIMSHQSP